ncbi:MAG: hypothetical protein EOP44_03175 [Sphingobacteriaceae bacterium]|nr:MAG: hypothetical protein EOP44_03175 [Sphingobacteriaceae bacterium]
METLENLQQQNAEVKSWSETTFREIKSRYLATIRGAKRSGDGFDSLKVKTRMTDGEISQVGFGYNRYLIFVHKGASRGHGGTKGSKWYDKLGRQRSTDPKSFGKMNTGSSRAKEWLNPVLDKEVPKLADIVAGFKAQAAIDLIKIKDS